MNKKDAALRLLADADLWVQLDPKAEGVIVPPANRDVDVLTLQFGLRLAVSIPDLVVDEDGISGTLTFARQPFWCYIPWTAIVCCSDGVGRGFNQMIWYEALTDEKPAAPPAPVPAPKARRLRAV